MLLRGGGSYYRIPGESRFSGGYGLEGGYGLSDQVGFVVNLDVKHLTFGEQIVGSFGVARLPDYLRGDRISASLFFDQITDTRVDTISHSLYLGQLRLQLGYSPTRRTQVGLQYSEPIIRDTDVNFRFVNFPGSLPMAGRVDASRIIGAYASKQFGQRQIAVTGGYRGDPGTFSLGVNLRREISDALSAYVSGSYETDQDNLATAFGLELALDNLFSTQQAPVKRIRHRRRSQRAAAAEYAESAPNAIQPVGYVPPKEIGEGPPSDGLGTFERRDLDPGGSGTSSEFNGTMPDNNPFQPLDNPFQPEFRDGFWAKWVRSNHRLGQQQFRDAGLTYSRRDADGFADPVQRAAQAVAGPLGYQQRDGRIIGADGQVFD